MPLYIEGAENLVDARIAYAKANGLSARVGATYRLPGAPWRKVWHDTESRPRGIADCRSFAIRHRTPPHIWASYEHDWVAQTVPLDLAAYALLHEADDPETNHAHAIQTEVFGFAAEGYSADKCDWLGRRVLRPILDAGIPIDVWLVAPTTGSDGYGEDGDVRQSWAWWETFAGQCGHANVPGNVHWDPGVADFTRIARAASPPPPPPKPRSHNTMDLVDHPSSGRVDLVYVTNELGILHYWADNASELYGQGDSFGWEDLHGVGVSVSAVWATAASTEGDQEDSFVVTVVGLDGRLYTKVWAQSFKWTSWRETPTERLALV